MVASSKTIAISGSNRPPLIGAKLLRKSDPKRSIKVSIYCGATLKLPSR